MAQSDGSPPLPTLVIPAQVGTQATQHVSCSWVPACAGMTSEEWCTVRMGPGTSACRRDLAHWHADVLAIVDAIDIPYTWAMLGRKPLLHWSVGRVSLLGDACHPTLPFLAQGANMAIEDGMVLARCLDAYDIPEALRRCEAARLDRTSRIVRASLENVSRYHNPQLADPVQAQAFMELEFAPHAMGARYDWLYEYDALTVPV
jgi:salicylate hydroxylase